ncbi:response regulator [Rhizobium laguerreae]|uniref:response regulator n=1 Tax=Rhizobium laguerreae TaxID=1076926 RepID=UPI001C91284E|nr:response regulator [Rhizobium laguerreae]MBY3349144.1 response regulator [Rhizobium laguerreae]MBY3356045.1 response regulator [Rhizobium laguerreae]MBY3370254.1 response regulator [Rhizobium laguerreae]MBY3377131.1 response regulator [Rhizobium laguerreae]MBY3391084.1 response regulator [Rhizobium laguerreae]
MSVQAAPTIVIVDDDTDVIAMVSDYLREKGMKVLSSATGRGLLRFVEARTPDLILLDLVLGAEDGLQVLRELRERSDVPIIIASGQRKDEIDRIKGLDLGADDYVTKPFGLRELLARINAVLRRQGSDYCRRKRGGVTYRFGGWKLRAKTRELHNPRGEEVRLTKVEHALLVAFLDKPRIPLAREHLLQSTRVHEDIFDRSIDVQILRLRKKIELDASSPRIILTQRGRGYVFALPVERD